MTKLLKEYQGKAIRIVTPCEVTAFRYKRDENDPIIHCETALWDTGASVSVISSHVATELKLSPTGMSYISGFDGKKSKANTYRINVKFSEKMQADFIEVVESPMITFDIIIGMDIIGMGDFVIKNRNIHGTQFSFVLD